jgi:hypothetical protein
LPSGLTWGDAGFSGAVSDIAARAATDSAPPPGRRYQRQRTEVPETFTPYYQPYAGTLTAPGGPLDADTFRAYLSRVRQFLAWLIDQDDPQAALIQPAATARSAIIGPTC